jgi:hypothetical protein
MSDLGWLGVSLLIVSLAAILVEFVLVADQSLRLAKRGQLLAERLKTEQVLLKTQVDTLMAQLQVTAVLWRPYGRLLRWLRHPLAIALLQSYARRRAAAR